MGNNKIDMMQRAVWGFQTPPLYIQLSLAIHHLSSFFWIGLSAGQISQVIVGDEQRQYLLVIGRDVDDVQVAQRLAQANEIVLSWNCWTLCEQYMFEVEIMKEDEAVKVGGWFCRGLSTAHGRQCSGDGHILPNENNHHCNSILEGGGGYFPRKIDEAEH